MGKRSRYLVQEWIFRYGSYLERAHDVIFSNKTDADKFYNECKKHLQSIAEDKDISDAFVKMYKLDGYGRVDKTIRCYKLMLSEL